MSRRGTPARNKQQKDIRKCMRKNCTNKFETTPNDTKVYCSHKCYSIDKIGTASHKKFPREKRICIREDCGVTFEVRLGYHQLYCCHECYSADLIGKKQSKETIRKRLIKIQASPNNFETNALTYVNDIYNNRVRYTGDGSLIINGRSADAELLGTKTVFLFNGIYWHLGKYGFENTEQAKGAIELIESIPFLEAGYKVIFIWEDDLNKLIRLKTKQEE